MSKFIKVTDFDEGVAVIILSRRVSSIIPHYDASGSIMYGVDGNTWHVKESIDQIEAQLLRDEFAKVALNGLLSNSEGVVQKSPMSGTGYVNGDDETVSAWAYSLADAMIKERNK
ncbi:hypothetical protein [Pseudomonas sp.]|uniref:hypothetical protein n=1 Tax=Pseudomonas sp. TaxID=306 RepID=UPI0026342817|nr:hypothetical protein [Pseudomonas sp.]